MTPLGEAPTMEEEGVPMEYDKKSLKKAFSENQAHEAKLGTKSYDRKGHAASLKKSRMIMKELKKTLSPAQISRIRRGLETRDELAQRARYKFSKNPKQRKYAASRVAALKKAGAGDRINQRSVRMSKSMKGAKAGYMEGKTKATLRGKRSRIYGGR